MKKEDGIKINPVKRQLKAGINLCTATMNIPKPSSDQDAYNLLQSKPGTNNF